MTCIVGLVHDGKVFMGADSAGASGWDSVVRRDSKIFHAGPFLMGFTTSFRMGQLLRYKLAVPGRSENQDQHAYMVTDFVDAVRECLKTGGYAKKDNEVETGGTFLVAYQGHLYQIQDDYQVMESADAFDACGCGSAVAKGAMFATEDILLPPKHRLMLALQAAERFNNGVCGPFHIEVTP
jgi:ATP-dependent protease HslVU (ClpYQ) peptidase subunit